MIFNSLTFVVFFLAVLVGYRLLPTWKQRKILLLLASYLFYASWNPPFVVLLWISTLVDWRVGRGINAADTLAKKRAWLLTSLGCNLGMLAYFKYSSFLMESLATSLGWAGLSLNADVPNIVLPMGISFYTFQTLSYTIDIYRGRASPWKSRLDYALYVTFFPQLVAGPIVRATDFHDQCVIERKVDADKLSWGVSLIIIGLFEKVVLADLWMSASADSVFNSTNAVGFVDSWIGTLAFSAQIYFDFAGYSLCAIGSALCLGFSIPDNFRFPYAAIGFSDFWRRWHISLSSWLRDYLYIPLGGNRSGPTRTQVNLMITMLLGGLWHGASWTFVVWGGLHGLYLMAERPVQRWLETANSPSWIRSTGARLAGAFATYLLVLVTWVFFRAQTFDVAWTMLRGMVGLGEATEPILMGRSLILPIVVTALLLGTHWFLRERSLEAFTAKLPWWVRGFALGTMLVAIITLGKQSRAFIYFQF